MPLALIVRRKPMFYGEKPSCLHLQVYLFVTNVKH